MPHSAVDTFRLQMLRHISRLDSLKASWVDWQPEIEKLVGSPPSEVNLFSLGDSLADIFRSRSIAGRGNPDLARGGVAWECLVCWYLNLVFWGTDVVAVRPHASFLPDVIKDALSVNIQNVSTNTESDLVVFSIPNASGMSGLNLSTIDQLLRTNSKNVSIAVVQCKTNWNDNSQIPMLWDLIYNSGSFRVPNVSVGRNGVSPSSFKNFVYSFVTVPTSKGPFHNTALHVLRVRGLTGGNYWGHPTVPSVARSVMEFFTANFPTHFPQPVQQHISTGLLNEAGVLNQFVNLSF